MQWNEPRQPLSTAPAGTHTQFDFGKSHPRILCCETERASEGEFEAAAQCKSVQQCERRKRQVLDAETDLLAASRSVPDLLRSARSKLLDICPGAKRSVAGPCQNQGAGVALGDLVESCFKAGHAFRIERVQCFWPVEPKDRVRTAPFDIYHIPSHKLQSGKGGNPDIPVMQKERAPMTAPIPETGLFSDYAPWRPTMAMDDTFWCGKPPRLCVMPMVGSGS